MTEAEKIVQSILDEAAPGAMMSKAEVARLVMKHVTALAAELETVKGERYSLQAAMRKMQLNTDREFSRANAAEAKLAGGGAEKVAVSDILDAIKALDDGGIEDGKFIFDSRKELKELLSTLSHTSGEVTEAWTDRTFRLRWMAAPRLPVHPSPMEGRQVFSTFDEALAFMAKQAPDAEFLSLEERSITTIDRSNDARAALRGDAS